MKLELNIKELRSKESRFLKDFLERDKPRFENQIREAIRREAEKYLSQVSIAVISKPAMFGNAEISLVMEYPDHDNIAQT